MHKVFICGFLCLEYHNIDKKCNYHKIRPLNIKMIVDEYLKLVDLIEEFINYECKKNYSNMMSFP